MAQSRDDLEKLLNEAKDLTSGSVSYVTTMRFVFSSNEIFVDLYTLAPDPSNIAKPQAQRIYRFVIPPALAKDFALTLLQGVNQWEEVHGINLPLKQVNESSE